MRKLGVKLILKPMFCGSRCCYNMKMMYILNEFRLFHPLAGIMILPLLKYFTRLFFLYLVLSMFHMGEGLCLDKKPERPCPKSFSQRRKPKDLSSTRGNVCCSLWLGSSSFSLKCRHFLCPASVMLWRYQGRTANVSII